LSNFFFLSSSFFTKRFLLVFLFSRPNFFSVSTSFHCQTSSPCLPPFFAKLLLIDFLLSC
jgi:hypothetical protein